MSGSPALLTTLVSALSTFLAFAMEVGLLVIALTHVRSRRPDASVALVIGAVMHLIPTVLWPIFTTFLIPALGGGVGSGGISGVYAVITLLSTLARTAGWAAIFFAIIKLASPLGGGPPRDPTRY